MRPRHGILILALALAACGDRPGIATGDAGSDQLGVRVALQVAVAEASFSTQKGFRWDSGSAHGTVPAGAVTLNVSGKNIGLSVDGRAQDLGPDPVRFSASTWRVGGDEYAGDLLVQQATWGGLTLINLVDIETYLRGVVPWEIGRPGDDAIEAVKAQAIAARTYTWRHLGRWAELDFDLYADTRDQVYRGLSGTAPITDRAVRETEGQVLQSGNELVRAYYSSTCGGHTSTLTDVWTREGAPYLSGFRDADDKGQSWCKDSAQFRWVEEWSARELGDRMREHLGTELGRELSPEEFGVLEGLEATEYDASGRVSLLKIRTDRAEFEVWGDRIRWVLRPAHSRFEILRSTMFRLEEQRRDGKLVGVVARGAGFGHGVGLCQTGALGRARAGQSAREILEAYYPGSTVRQGGAI